MPVITTAAALCLLAVCADSYGPAGAPEPTTFTLTTNVATTGGGTGGTVARNPNHARYLTKTTVTVTATPADGYRFNGWSGAANTPNPVTTVTMNSDQALTANFERIMYTLTVDRNITDGGTVSPDGGNYLPGTSVSITAAPAEGYRFVNWTGAVTSTDNTVTVTMNNNQTITANFRYPHSYNLLVTTNPYGGGWVSHTTNPCSNWRVSQGKYLILDYCIEGIPFTLNATPDDGYIFSRWLGASTSTNDTVTITMNSDQRLTADFTWNITYGSFTDLRDGRSYRTIVIGTQTWMSDNLNFNTDGSVCYDNNPSNCNTYGRLYDWATAMNLPSSCNYSSCANQIQSQHQGVCPIGWHIPTDVEWTTLTNFVGMERLSNRLRARSGWDTPHFYDTICYNSPHRCGSAHQYHGTDNFGFSALPGGFGTQDAYSFVGAGRFGFWWSTADDETMRFGQAAMSMFADVGGIGLDSSNKHNYRSLRCIMNE